MPGTEWRGHAQDATACEAARDALDGKEVSGREIKVNNARQQVEDGGGGGDGGDAAMD
jgi:hypothetical protein